VHLHGKNFQSWAEFDIDIEGLTVVTGPSDVGKSALFRALKGVLRNELAAEYVRNGQENPMELALSFGGHLINAKRKKKGSTTYVIDGQDFAKLAGGVPDQLKDLKFGEVLIGDFDFDPIFGRQNSAQFLIDPLTYKPTEVNAILGAFGGTEKLEHGKKEANLRKTQKDGEARTIAEQIRDAEERKAKLTGMQAEGERIGAALTELESEVTRRETKVYWLDEAIRYRLVIVQYRPILDGLRPPDISGLERDYRLIQAADVGAQSAAFAKWLAKPIAALASASALWNDVQSLQGQIATLEAARRAKKSTDWWATAANPMSAAETIWSEARRLWNEIVALESAIAAGKHVVSTDRLKSSLSDVEDTYYDVVRLWNSIKRMEVLSALLGEITDSAERLAGVEIELSAAQAELQKGLCPKCGKALSHQCV
jgi:DNA repair exonuclease SbcCD ATPase subunit